MFNAAALALAGTEENTLVLELRLRTVIELAIHEKFYLSNRNLMKMSESCEEPTDAVSYIVNSTVSDANIGQLENAYREEVMQSIMNSRYTGMLHLYGLCSAINYSLESIFPNYQSVAINRQIMHQTITPRSGMKTSERIHIMWSNLLDSNLAGSWQANHFVACFNTSYETIEQHEVNKLKSEYCNNII